MAHPRRTVVDSIDWVRNCRVVLCSELVLLSSHVLLYMMVEKAPRVLLLLTSTVPSGRMTGP